MRSLAGTGWLGNEPFFLARNRAVAQLASALAWGARGQEFKSPRPDFGRLWHQETELESRVSAAETIQTLLLNSLIATLTLPLIITPP